MEVESRARLHAAMADPGRLRVIDLLALGDATPGELRRRLGVSSNLLAHHLRALEDAGLITRHRSEGDRRRTYVSLRPENVPTVGEAAPTVAAVVPRVVFVCTANSARSQLAAALWRQRSPVPAASAGTHPARHIAAGAAAAAKRHGLSLDGPVPQRLSDVIANGDFVVTVCDNAFEELHDHGCPPTLHWSVPDPVRPGTEHAFDAACDNIARRVSYLEPRLVAG